MKYMIVHTGKIEWWVYRVRILDNGYFEYNTIGTTHLFYSEVQRNNYYATSTNKYNTYLSKPHIIFFDEAISISDMLKMLINNQ